MEEYVRLFFTGEALQRVFASVCNGSNREVQYKISKTICSMLRTTLCIRLTPMGLAPFKSDITMVFPYSMMDRAQLDYLDNLLQQASFTNSPGEPVCAIGLGSEVVVITVLDSVRVWSDPGRERPPLAHRQGGKELRSMEEASRVVNGRPLGGDTQWQIDTVDLLKAFVSCVFRSSTFKDNDTRTGVCDITIQMVIHDIGLTQNMVDMLRSFIQGIKRNEGMPPEATRPPN